MYPTCLCVLSSLPVFGFQKALVNALHDSIQLRSQYPPEFYLSLSFHHLFYNADLKNEVKLTVNRSLCFARFQNYKFRGITPANFTFQALLETVKPKQVMHLVKLLLLEKKIIIIRDNCDDNAVLIESLLALLSPLYFFSQIIASGAT